MTISDSSAPLDFACPHVATAQELHRDPSYAACSAEHGAPCKWAKRYDGYRDPLFHSERLEFAVPSSPGHELDPQLLREAVLQSGLV